MKFFQKKIKKKEIKDKTHNYRWIAKNIKIKKRKRKTIKNK